MTSKYLLLIAIALPFFISSCSDKYSEQDKMQVINNVDTPFGRLDYFSDITRYTIKLT